MGKLEKNPGEVSFSDSPYRGSRANETVCDTASAIATAGTHEKSARTISTRNVLVPSSPRPEKSAAVKNP